ncbi:MAG: hypothetical protein ABIS03_03615, partial [Gemmatimonadaceae bacterium]
IRFQRKSFLRFTTMTSPTDLPAPARGLRAILAGVWHGKDSLLHAHRRRKARQILTGNLPHSTVFLCHGNICRSPFAAVLFQQILPPFVANQVAVSSAGFIGPGRPTPNLGIASAAQLGVDLSGHRSGTIEIDTLNQADLIVVMEPAQAGRVESLLTLPGKRILILGDIDPEPIDRRRIADPWNGDRAAFDASYARIDRCVRELAALVTGGNHAAG